MKKSRPGTIVMELNHAGIPDSELKPEIFDDRQLTVMSALESRFQDNIRKGYPYTVMDMESGKVLEKFNLHNVKPSESQMNAMARSLLVRPIAISPARVFLIKVPSFRCKTSCSGCNTDLRAGYRSPCP